MNALFFSSCFPTPQIPDISEAASLWSALQPKPYGHCLMAGLNNSTAGSGVLACLQLDSFHCASTAYFSGNASRSELTNQINQIANDYSNCLLPASNALSEINALSLPAYLTLKRGGGTNGAHLSSNSSLEIVESCQQIGLDTSAFRNSSARLATQEELLFLFSARGLVASKDTGGNCRTQMGLTSQQEQIANAYLAGNFAISAVCDYGNPDAGKSDCPASLEQQKYKFQGINGW